MKVASLVCRGKFGRAEGFETSPTKKQEVPEGESNGQIHGMLAQKRTKKKKKKKFRDEAGVPAVTNGMKVLLFSPSSYLTIIFCCMASSKQGCLQRKSKIRRLQG